MGEQVNWQHRAGHMLARHGITVAEATEALADASHVILAPDYNSRSGDSVRVIGYSSTAGAILTIIIAEIDGVIYGVNGWPANSRDRKTYQER